MASSASAQIYMGISDSGSLVLSNHASEEAGITLIHPPASHPLAPVSPTPYPQAPHSRVPAPSVPGAAAPPRFAVLIQEAARRQALPAPLLTAMITVESGFNDRAISPKGAAGLMQLMPATARRMGVRNPFVPEDNIHAGAAYLRELLGQFRQDTTLALAAYNAGPAAVRRAGGRVPDIAETRDYVTRVLALSGLPKQ
jgi:soluble lytic murein transglycosylase-like protein